MTEMRRPDPLGLTSLVIPAYNPGREIERTWHTLADFVRGAADPWEVIFVCDGCTDGTPDRLRVLAAADGGPFRVIHYPTNHGKGHAVRTGLAAARGRWLLFTDADLAYPLDDIERVACQLRTGSAVAIGSREHPASEILMPPGLIGYAFRRRIQSQAFGTLARLLLGIRHGDPQAGLKGMQATVARALLPRLRQDGFAFDCELLTACARLGIPVTEVPVHLHVADRHTTTGLRSSLRTVRQLFAIRRDWRATTASIAWPRLRLPVQAA
jgi:glycosyltransferase involved in cell wall biosynthesis